MTDCSKKIQETTKSDVERAIEGIGNPRSGSKIAAVQEFSVDLALLIKNLQLPPQERINDLRTAMRFMAKVQKQGSVK